MDLAFFAADTLGVTLFQTAGGLKANEVHQLRLGPWKLDTEIEVTSDVITPTALSFWVTMNKTLHLYVIVRERENYLFVLDADLLKACGESTGFAGLTTKARVQEFKPAIKGLFQWKGNHWDKVAFGVEV